MHTSATLGAPMRHLLVFVLLTLSVTLGLGAASPATGAASTSPVLLEGDVSGAADIVAVTVTIDPTDDVLTELEVGETAPPVLTPDTRTAISGTHFEVRLDPATIPHTYLDADGVIFAMVTVLREGAAPLTTLTSARAVASPSGDTVAWVDALESSEAATQSGRARVAGRLVPTDPDPHDHAVVVQARDYDTIFRGSDPTDTPQGCSDTKVAQRTRSTTIGTTYPVGGDKAAMTVDSSTGASYGTAWSIKNSQGVFGEFRASQAKYTRSGWGFAWDGSSRSRSYRKGILYGRFVRTCARGCDHCFRFWKPLAETGGTGSNTQGVTRPDWDHCVRIDRGLWWRDDSDGHNYEYGSAVKFADVIGIDLSISREYNSHQKLWYRATTHRRMCGNDDLPATAGKVMMKYAR